MRFKDPYYLFLSLSLFIASCESSRDGYALRPVKSLMHPEPELPDVESQAFHLNDSVTRIFFSIANDRLLYKRPDTSKAFYSHLRISCNLLPVDHPRIIADSCSEIVLDKSETEVVEFKRIRTYLDVKARLENNYELDINLVDLNRRVKYKKIMLVIKENKTGAQNFLLLRQDTVMLRNWFTRGEDLVVRYTYPQDEMLSVLYFGAETGAAPPPFSSRSPEESRPKSDSIIYLELNDNSSHFKVPSTGFVFIKAHKASGQGACIFTVDEGFPGLSSTREMIQCTRYVMSKEEYESCLNAADPKVAIDEFWLNIGGSKERAREMLKKYYSRVMDANRNYSSYLPGWKTDRGMIYIVMGNPSKIFKTREIETWIYGNEASVNALRFVFVKPSASFTENDLVLERSSYYRDPYHMAVEYWRQGVVYNDQR